MIAEVSSAVAEAVVPEPVIPEAVVTEAVVPLRFVLAVNPLVILG